MEPHPPVDIPSSTGTTKPAVIFGRIRRFENGHGTHPDPGRFLGMFTRTISDRRFPLESRPDVVIVRSPIDRAEIASNLAAMDWFPEFVTVERM